MDKIIGKASTGKTRKLIAKAKGNGAIIVCSNPAAIINKSNSYGFGMITCMSYEEYYDKILKGEGLSEKYYIDDIDTYMEYVTKGTIYGYTLTED